jgi:hypothetical protein
MLEKLGKYSTAELTDLKALNEICTGPGVYFMIYVENDKHTYFPRLNGKIDKEGILLIGTSTNLKRRIRDFYRDVFDETLNRNSHSEGWNLRKYFRDNHFPGTIKLNAKNIRVCWKELKNKEDAEKFETECIQHYIMQYQDKPPLNINIKRQREIKTKKDIFHPKPSTPKQPKTAKKTAKSRISNIPQNERVDFLNVATRDDKIIEIVKKLGGVNVTTKQILAYATDEFLNRKGSRFGIIRSIAKRVANQTNPKISYVKNASSGKYEISLTESKYTSND